MIKGLGYLKSLKLFGIGLGISFFMGLGVNSVSAVGHQVESNGIIVERNGTLISVDGGLKFQVSGRGSLLTQYLGVSRRMLAFSAGSPKVYFFWYNGKPYSYYYYPSDGVFFQGFNTTYEVCNALNPGDTVISGCNSYPITDSFEESVSNFFSTIKSTDYFGYNYGYYTVYGRQYFVRVCFSSSLYNSSVCFNSAGGLTGSLHLSGDIVPGDISNGTFGNPPTSGGNIDGGNSYISSDTSLTGDIIFSNVSTGFALNYMQGGSRNFRPDICYAGTFDSTSSYGTRGVSYEAGTGYNIFQLYNLYYGDYHNSRYGLQSVANWIDTRIINYYGWFMLDGNPSNHGLAYYDSGTNLWEKYYDNYSFPFANNPVAVYFLANNIYDYGLYYGNVNDLPGSNVVDYCNMLINGSTIDDMISPGLKSDIIGNYSRNQTSPEDMFDYSSIDYTSSQWRADGSSWSGVFDASSGAIIVDGTNFINTFFNKVKSKFQMPENGGGNGLLPGYIVVFMLALVFFRYLRH